jgi:cytochrome c biogenesis protein ResB
MKLTPVDILAKVFKFLKSVRLSAVVIGLLILIYFLGLVLPQKWMFLSAEHYEQWKDENFLNALMDLIGFTDIYLSPVTITLLGLFFINLLVVTLNRVPIILKRAHMTGDKPSFTFEDIKRGSFHTISPVKKNIDPFQGAARFFKKKKWRVIKGTKENTCTAIKNRFSPIGFLLFHFSFLLCLIGGLLIAYTRFSGELVLTEGQEFKGDITQFKSIGREPKIFKELPPLALMVDNVVPYYEKNVPTELLVQLKISYKEDMWSEEVRVNEPVHRGPISILAQSLGVSPLFIVKGPGGRELDGAYVSLNVLQGEEDAFRFEKDQSIKFNVKFYPDYIVEDGVEKTKSIELKNPVMHLTIEKDGEVINEGTISQGEYISLGSHTSIGFKEIRYWAEFIIVREYGKTPLMAGFLFASVGLIMRLVFYQRRIRLAIEYEDGKSILYMDGRSEYFQHSFKDELGTIVKELEKCLG